MMYDVTDIEFDFDDDSANGFELTYDEQIAIRDSALGVWEADNEDDMIDEITAATGYLIILMKKLIILLTSQLTIKIVRY